MKSFLSDVFRQSRGQFKGRSIRAKHIPKTNYTKKVIYVQGRCFMCDYGRPSYQAENYTKEEACNVEVLILLLGSSKRVPK